jgi:hypothetical protein
VSFLEKAIKRILIRALNKGVKKRPLLLNLNEDVRERLVIMTEHGQTVEDTIYMLLRYYEKRESPIPDEGAVNV